ncbi:acylphosphatase [Patescibacteria group bacterium]|nr:acylphosphatase [Patescibacteria group bacterium]
MKRRTRLIVHGAVQGVFFRENTVKYATMHGITGTVRNCDDATVEIIAEGDENALDKLTKWSREGPSGAQVSAVDVDVSDYTDEFKSFTIIR